MENNVEDFVLDIFEDHKEQMRQSIKDMLDATNTEYDEFLITKLYEYYLRPSCMKLLVDVDIEWSNNI